MLETQTFYSITSFLISFSNNFFWVLMSNRANHVIFFHLTRIKKRRRENWNCGTKQQEQKYEFNLRKIWRLYTSEWTGEKYLKNISYLGNNYYDKVMLSTYVDARSSKRVATKTIFLVSFFSSSSCFVRFSV